ncbi:hypothetical protein BSU01_23050 [Erwinia billingiae]|uniref:fimbrial protein n=1 Tax=Erwinia billingiae TaxID=182337 RepID=UPI0019D23734|nr:hypothetical protein [Erwinia billingiae]
MIVSEIIIHLIKRVTQMRVLITTFTVIVFWGMSIPAKANCNGMNGWSSKNIIWNLPATLAVGSHLPVGSVIHSEVLTLGPSYQEYARCTQSTDSVLTTPAYGYTVSQGYIVHPSAPGIGYRFTVSLGQVNGVVPFTQYPITPPSTTLNLGPDPKVQVEIIKLSGAGGQIVAGFPMQYWVRSTTGVSGSAFNIRFPNPTNLVTTTCQVSNPVINVPMGNVNTSIFPRVGSTSPARNFTIRLNCDPQANVNLTVDALADTSRAPGVLSLSTLPDRARGVGIQVLQNNAPVTFGQIKSIGRSAGGIYNIPMSARYYQTQGQVTSGRANGTATFTMTYN